ncbi:MAG: hypothetical protein PUF46_08975, partial [Oscillospiraceae bacterium]|nr:hypothetical protein [Oscillospiraceae bacterium]
HGKIHGQFGLSAAIIADQDDEFFHFESYSQFFWQIPVFNTYTFYRLMESMSTDFSRHCRSF